MEGSRQDLEDAQAGSVCDDHQVLAARADLEVDDGQAGSERRSDLGDGLRVWREGAGAGQRVERDVGLVADKDGRGGTGPLSWGDG